MAGQLPHAWHAWSHDRHDSRQGVDVDVKDSYAGTATSGMQQGRNEAFGWSRMGLRHHC
jgi:hypothetical protein